MSGLGCGPVIHVEEEGSYRRWRTASYAHAAAFFVLVLTIVTGDTTALFVGFWAVVGSGVLVVAMAVIARHDARVRRRAAVALIPAVMVVLCGASVMLETGLMVREYSGTCGMVRTCRSSLLRSHSCETPDTEWFTAIRPFASEPECRGWKPLSTSRRYVLGVACGRSELNHLTEAAERTLSAQANFRSLRGRYAAVEELAMETSRWRTNACTQSSTYENDRYTEVLALEIDGKKTCWSLDETGALRELSAE